MISIRTEAILSAARDAARIGAAGISGALYRAAALQTNREVRKTTRALTSAWRVARVMEALALENNGYCAADDRVFFGHAYDDAALELKAWLTRSHSGRTIDRVLASVAA